MSKFVEVLNSTLKEILQEDDKVYLMGESIEDPYGGAFKVTKGLSTLYPTRVFDTPISEAGLTGFVGGMALRGMRPVLEIMFGDFLGLCMDQILNSATKFKWMYNDQVEVPFVIRTAMGGRRGYGPTHSQTIEKLFTGIPNLNIVAPSNLHDVNAILKYSVLEDRLPTLFIENKLLYGVEMLNDQQLSARGFSVARYNPPIETVVLRPSTVADADLSIITYGGMVPLVLEIIGELLDKEDIAAELVVPSGIAPIVIDPILESVSRTKKAIVVEEGGKTNGWGSEVSSLIHENIFSELSASVERVASMDLPIPSYKGLELEMLSNKKSIIQAVMKLL